MGAGIMIGRAALGFAGPLAALLVAGLGGFVVRRRPAWLPAVFAGAVFVGWGLLEPSWRSVLAPANAAERLAGAAGGLLLAAMARVAMPGRGGRWWTVGGVAFAGWWLAGSVPQAMFWRAWFGVGAAAWVFERLGACDTRRASAAAGTLWAGLVLAGAPGTWTGAALVLVAGSVALLGVGAAGVAVAGAMAVGVVGAEIGAGRLLRGGGVGLVEMVCLMTVAAAWLAGRIEPGARRRFGRLGVIVAPLLTAAVAVGIAWVLARALRGA